MTPAPRKEQGCELVQPQTWSRAVAMQLETQISVKSFDLSVFLLPKPEGQLEQVVLYKAKAHCLPFYRELNPKTV